MPRTITIVPKTTETGTEKRVAATPVCRAVRMQCSTQGVRTGQLTATSSRITMTGSMLACMPMKPRPASKIPRAIFNDSLPTAVPEKIDMVITHLLLCQKHGHSVADCP